MQINLNHLRIFYYAAKEKNLTKAAEALFVTQPAVTMQIKALEQAFRTLGSGLERPFLTLQTFCFTGLPFIRLTDKGLADIRTKKFLDLVVEE